MSIRWLEGVEIATKGKISGGTTFLPAWLLGTIGCVIVEGGFNQVDSGGSLTV